MIMKNDRISKIIDISDLEIVEELQRGVRPTMVDYIAKNFNPKSIGKILCNYRNGKYYVIDGQHRLLALRKLGYKSVECDVYHELTNKEEAEIYKQMATSSLHSSYEKFRAELILGNPQCLNVKAIVNSFKLEISNSKSSTKISCINELTKCFKEDAGLLNTTLDLFINKLKFNNGITGVELRGMFLFLKKALNNSKFDYKFFINRVSTKSQSQILKIGSTNKEANYTTPAKGYALALLSVYNFNKKDENRLSIDLIN